MNARGRTRPGHRRLLQAEQDAGLRLVPSQSGERNYRVNVEKQTCICPDHLEAGFKCKHLFTVEFTARRELSTDGSVTETKTVTFTEKVAYQQVWPAYNHAQSIEKDRRTAPRPLPWRR